MGAFAPAKRYVPIATKAAGSRVIVVEEGATVGATIGINLFNADGTLFDPAAAQAPDDTDETSDEFTYWKLIQEVPRNLVELAKLTGSGFAYRNSDGTWRLRKVGRQVVGFAYGDASPATIYTPSADAVFTLCRVVIDTPFDGAGAALAVGTAADPEILMPASNNGPAIAASFESTPDTIVDAGTDIRVTITPGAGATAGAGRIILDSIPVEGI